eukprot:SM000006S19361  [mRNA]  locus=s6:331521:333918:+ [translate_table: standard]
MAVNVTIVHKDLLPLGTLNVRIHHHCNKLLERCLGRPSKGLLGFSSRAPQIVHLRGPEIAWINLNVLLPVQTHIAKGRHQELLHSPSIQDVPGRFVVEKDAIACKEAICLSVIDSVPMSSNLCHGIRRSRMEHCILVLRRRCCSIHLRRPCLVVLHLPAGVFNVSANSLKQPVQEEYLHLGRGPVGINVDMIESLRVEVGRSPNDAMHLVALGQEELGRTRPGP